MLKHTHKHLDVMYVLSFLLSLSVLKCCCCYLLFFFFFNDTATTEIYTNLNTLSLHDALPISSELQSHSEISYAVFCLKKKNRRDRKSTRLNSSHIQKSRMPSSARKKKKTTVGSTRRTVGDKDMRNEKGRNSG